MQRRNIPPARTTARRMQIGFRDRIRLESAGIVAAKNGAATITNTGANRPSRSNNDVENAIHSQSLGVNLRRLTSAQANMISTSAAPIFPNAPDQKGFISEIMPLATMGSFAW